MFRTTRQKRNSSLSILGVTLVGVSIVAIIFFRTTRQKNNNSSLSILGVTLVGVSIAAIIFLPDNSPKWMLSTESNKTTLQEHKNLILVSCLRGALPPVDFLAVLSALYICCAVCFVHGQLAQVDAKY